MINTSRTYKYKVTPGENIRVGDILTTDKNGCVRKFVFGVDSVALTRFDPDNMMVADNMLHIDEDCWVYGRSLPSAEPISDPLREAAMALYMAGTWSLNGKLLDGTTEAGLWEALREALGLPVGTATAAGVGQ